jgi:hypothetical protein
VGGEDTADPEERHRAQDAGRVGDTGDVADGVRPAGGLADHGSVGVQHALGVRGGAGRVDHDRGVGRRHLGLGGGEQGGVRARRTVRVPRRGPAPVRRARQDDAAQERRGGELDPVGRLVGEAGEGGLEPVGHIDRQHLRGADEQLDVGEPEDLAELGRRVHGAQRHDERADPARSQPPLDPLDAAREEQADPRALADSRGQQAPGDPRRATVGVGVGQPVHRIHHVLVVAALPHGTRQQFRDGGPLFELS